MTSENNTTLQSIGLTVDEYALSKKLPATFLRGLGLEDTTYFGTPAVGMPYRDEDGKKISTYNPEKEKEVEVYRYRIAMQGDKFRWEEDVKVKDVTYRYPLGVAPKDHREFVEGESDCQTLWHHGFPAIGIPGVKTITAEGLEKIIGDGTDKIYFNLEPDQENGHLPTVIQELPQGIRDRCYYITNLPEGAKDPSELHIKAPELFKERWRRQGLAEAIPVDEWYEQRKKKDREVEFADHQDFAQREDLIEQLKQDAFAEGLAEADANEFLTCYLSVASRVLPFEQDVNCETVSVGMFGVSSVGKSKVVKSAMRFHPKNAYKFVHAQSENALYNYNKYELQNKALIVAELNGIDAEHAQEAARHMAEDGYIKRDVSIWNPKLKMHEAKTIHVLGPTPLIFTTIKTPQDISVELCNRILPVTIEHNLDRSEQIKHKTMLKFSKTMRRKEKIPQLTKEARNRWHKHSDYVAGNVNVDFHDMPEVIERELPPSTDAREHRDLPRFMHLWKTLSVFMQGSRELDEDGWIRACCKDYRVARELTAEVFAIEQNRAISMPVRRAVTAVKELSGRKLMDESFSPSEVAMHLQLDRGNIGRDLRAAWKLDLLENIAKYGKNPRYKLGRDMPNDDSWLPPVSAVEAVCCNVVNDTEGIPTSTDTQGVDEAPQASSETTSPSSVSAHYRNVNMNVPNDEDLLPPSDRDFVDYVRQKKEERHIETEDDLKDF